MHFAALALAAPIQHMRLCILSIDPPTAQCAMVRLPPLCDWSSVWKATSWALWHSSWRNWKISRTYSDSVLRSDNCFDNGEVWWSYAWHSRTWDSILSMMSKQSNQTSQQTSKTTTSLLHFRRRTVISMRQLWESAPSICTEIRTPTSFLGKEVLQINTASNYCLFHTWSGQAGCFSRPIGKPCRM